jgi:benzoyl-CoA reductase subunit BamC
MLLKNPIPAFPLKCDMCEDEEEPLCVKWCLADALTYEEREEEVEEEVKVEEMETGLKSLVDKYGLQKIWWIPLPECHRKNNPAKI